MIDNFEKAVQELRRVDHLFWVSLKYTRTVDVIRNTINRLINVYDYSINSMLKYAKDKKIIKEIPGTPFQKCEELEKLFPKNSQVKACVDKFLLLRKIINANYTKREEFRRHVTMTVNIEGETIEVNIDLLKEYYDETKNFLSYLKGVVQEEDEL